MSWLTSGSCSTWSAMTQERSTHWRYDSFHVKQGGWDRLTAVDIMTADVISIDCEASIFKVMEILVAAKCSGLAVVGKQQIYPLSSCLSLCHLYTSHGQYYHAEFIIVVTYYEVDSHMALIKCAGMIVEDRMVCLQIVKWWLWVSYQLMMCWLLSLHQVPLLRPMGISRLWAGWSRSLYTKSYRFMHEFWLMLISTECMLSYFDGSTIVWSLFLAEIDVWLLPHE